MAKFYGTVRGQRGEASRLGHSSITTRAASWEGAIETTLFEKDGRIHAEVWMRTHNNTGTIRMLYSGPVGEYAPIT